MAEDRDVVIVGAGIAGLVAAQRLQDRAPLVLEAGDRVGGRMWSQRRGDLALSVGAHMFPPPDSVIGRLVAEHGLEVMPITGSMLNIHYGGRLVRDTRPELMPFRLPMSLRGRISFARAGLKVKRDGDRYMKLIEHRPGDTEAAIRLRGLQHGGDQTFAEFLGPLHPAGRRDLPRPRQPLDRRARGDLAGRHGGAVRPRVGQRRPRPQHARRLGPAAGCPRPRRWATPSACAAPSSPCTWTVPACASATPARAAAARCAPARRSSPPRARSCRRCSSDIPPDVASALALIRMGPMVVVSLLTDETEPMPWDGLYSVLTPDKRFNMIFNHADFAHGAGLPRTRQRDHGLRRRRPRAGYLNRTDDELRDDFLADLYTVFPQVRGRIVETMVKRWQYAGPFAAPGRWRAQAALERGIDDRIFFAGDWVSDFVSMETAALTAVDAATNVRRVLGEVAAPA